MNVNKPIVSLVFLILVLSAITFILNISLPSDINSNPIKMTDTVGRLETKIGESQSVFYVHITPLEVLEDSRCSIDVACIQEGTVKVETLLTTSLGEISQIFELNHSVGAPTEEVTLVEVTPEKQSDSTIEAKDYIFVFEVKKL